MKVVVNLSFCRDFHPAALRQLAWRTRLSLATLASVSLTHQNATAYPGFDKDHYTLRQIRVEQFLGLIPGNLAPVARPMVKLSAEALSEISEYIPFLAKYERAKEPNA